MYCTIVGSENLQPNIEEQEMVIVKPYEELKSS